MWISLNIISKMVDIKDISPEDLALKLTMSTAEIDSIDYMNSHFDGILSSKILNINPHPNADKLLLVDLDAGKMKCRVVCGASNFKKDDIVALATPGTKFSDEMIIKKTKIRGEESSGMLCSEKELALSDDHSGIMILPSNTPPGKPLSELFPEWVDIRLEIDNKSITHRPDLWSHQGFAREIGALLGKPVKDPVDISIADKLENKEKLSVKILNPESAPRYSGLVVKGIKIEESPSWLKANVSSIGMRPINNIVDITNYVMAELGEPMHAFDRKKLKGDEIIVRMAKNGESLMTLDGQEFKLNKEDIVISDKSGAIALAGVMGGGNSEIDEKTTEIVLEAANFNPVNIRKTATRYNQRTEAAIRFEKSLSPELTSAAIIRCYELIKLIIPGSEATSKIIDDFPVKSEKISIETTTDFIRKRLGQEISDKRIIDILESLDFKLKVNGSNLNIDVPHYRATKDISIPEDIVEEVGRIFGYDNIKPIAPIVPCITPRQNRFRIFERTVKDILTKHADMIEVSGYSFVGEETLNKLNINEEKELFLSNPLSQEQDRLRRSLFPNIIGNVELNLRYNDEFKIYEMGRVYLKNNRKSSELATEKTMVTGAIFKKLTDHSIFYSSRNIITTLLEKLKFEDYKLIPDSEDIPSYAHPARTLKLMTGKKNAGYIFELHPEISEKLEITGHVAIFDIDLDILFEAAKSEMEFVELQKFPEVPFEISVIADKFTYADEVCSIIKKSSKDLIKSVDVISIYEGEQIPDGKKSISIKIIFVSKKKTLATDEVNNLQNGVIKSLEKDGYQLR